MTDAEIRQGLVDFLRAECGIADEQLSSTEALFSSGLLDSMDILKCVMHIESGYNLSISPLEVSLDSFDTLDRIVDFIKSRTSQ